MINMVNQSLWSLSELNIWCSNVYYLLCWAWKEKWKDLWGVEANYNTLYNPNLKSKYTFSFLSVWQCCFIVWYDIKGVTTLLWKKSRAVSQCYWAKMNV